jgi:hypothetical protein
MLFGSWSGRTSTDMLLAISISSSRLLREFRKKAKAVPDLNKIYPGVSFKKRSEWEAGNKGLNEGLTKLLTTLKEQKISIKRQRVERLRQLQFLCDWVRTDRTAFGLHRFHRCRSKWGRLVLHPRRQPSRSRKGAPRFREADSVCSSAHRGDSSSTRGSGTPHGCRRPSEDATAGQGSRTTDHSFGVSKAATPPQTTKGLIGRCRS